MELTLVMFKPDGTRRDFPVDRPRVVLGRKNNCDLRIPLPSISRQHCEILLDGSAARLNDLGSSNGTLLNGKRVNEVSLRAGDLITVGPVVFTVVVDGKPADVQPQPMHLTDLDGSSLNGRSAGASSPGAADRSGTDHTITAADDSLTALDNLANDL